MNPRSSLCSLAFFASLSAALSAALAAALAAAPPSAIPAPAAPAATTPKSSALPESIQAAVDWYRTLGFPSTKGLPRVRITSTSKSLERDYESINHTTGWLIAQEGTNWRVLMGTDADLGFGTGDGFSWPLYESVVTARQSTEHRYKFSVTLEKRTLKADAEEMLANLGKASKEAKGFPKITVFGGGIHGGSSIDLFVLGQSCLENDLPELGAALLTRAAGTSDANFKADLESQFSHAARWRIFLEFGAPKISRPTLLANCEAAMKHFPALAVDGLQPMADRLRRMIAEDEAHARLAIKLDELKGPERARELVFRLRDQNGHQSSQPGWCSVFDQGDGKFNNDGNSPAHELKKMGHAAVPALIDALDDDRYSRSVGYWRHFSFSHHVLTVGECAEQILTAIAERSFSPEKPIYAGQASQRERADVIRPLVEAWWKEIQQKGERQALIDATAVGDNNSPEQGVLLHRRYPADAAAALIRGAQAAKHWWPRTRLVHAMEKVEGEPILEFLRKEAIEGQAHDSRVAAIEILVRRDPAAARAGMRAEWERMPGPVVDPIGKNQEETQALKAQGSFETSEWEPRLVRLLELIYQTGDARTIEAVAASFAAKPFWVRKVMIQAASAENIYRNRNGLPARKEEESAAANAALEALLARGLDEREERLCDETAAIMHERWPKKFAYEKAESSRKREAQIIAIQNVRRAAAGLPALALPE